MNHRPVSKIVVASFGLIAVTLSAIQCGTSHSEEQVQKRAQSPAPILLQQAFEKASEEHDLDLLEQVALVQARMGDISSALRTIGSAKLVGWRDRRFADLSKALSARGDIAGAIKVASAIDASSWSKKETLSEIGQAQANAGDISNATKTAGELPGYLRADVLQAIALRQVENDNIQDAFKTLASIDLPGDVVRR